MKALENSNPVNFHVQIFLRVFQRGCDNSKLPSMSIRLSNLRFMLEADIDIYTYEIHVFLEIFLDFKIFPKFEFDKIRNGRIFLY